jgi:hypothetical protein
VEDANRPQEAAVAKTKGSDEPVHWHKLVENFETSSKEFYVAVEAGLKRRELPSLRVSRVRWSEGGPISPDREYLRVAGGRHSFDMCAAPFGTGFFFSSWVTPRKSSTFGQVVVILLVVLPILWTLPRLFMANRAGMLPTALSTLFFHQLWLPIIAFFGALLLVALMARAGVLEPELAVMDTPVIGAIYRAFFYRETYYRIDTMLMFQSAVHSAMLEVIDGLMTQKGLRALSEDERKPVFKQLT